MYPSPSPQYLEFISITVVFHLFCSVCLDSSASPLTDLHLSTPNIFGLGLPFWESRPETIYCSPTLISLLICDCSVLCSLKYWMSVLEPMGDQQHALYEQYLWHSPCGCPPARGRIVRIVVTCRVNINLNLMLNVKVCNLYSCFSVFSSSPLSPSRLELYSFFSKLKAFCRTLTLCHCSAGENVAFAAKRV